MLIFSIFAIVALPSFSTTSMFSVNLALANTIVLPISENCPSKRLISRSKLLSTSSLWCTFSYWTFIVSLIFSISCFTRFAPCTIVSVIFCSCMEDSSMFPAASSDVERSPRKLPSILLKPFASLPTSSLDSTCILSFRSFEVTVCSKCRIGSTIFFVMIVMITIPTTSEIAIAITKPCNMELTSWYSTFFSNAITTCQSQLFTFPTKNPLVTPS